MRILHYALGFPPYRTGGLTKFCIDLMLQQKKQGHEVALLWPGEMKFLSRKVFIKDKGDKSFGKLNIHSFEVINPLPISYDEGIIEIDEYTKDVDMDVYRDFLEMYRPNVVHVHTLMGLHKSFLSAAKEQNIRLIFTTHDFFPICPKVTMFRNQNTCGSVQSCDVCGSCNKTALSLRKIKLLQSPVYRYFKESIFIKYLRKRHRQNFFIEKTLIDEVDSSDIRAEYLKLRNFYYSMLSMMDSIHYNSTVTKDVYESVFGQMPNKIISITHGDIQDNRRKKFFINDKLRIRYLGSSSSAKGFYLLKEALDSLWKNKKDFCLDIHFEPMQIEPYMKIHKRYTYEMLEQIFEETDVLVAPSLWCETFGYTVLEAVSYGVPVIISDTVGAKDVLVNGAGIIIDDIDSKKLCYVLQQLTTEDLKNMNKIILKNQSIIQIDYISNEIEKYCYKCGESFKKNGYN